MVTLLARKNGRVVTTEQFPDEDSAYDRRDELLQLGFDVQIQGVRFCGWCADGGADDDDMPIG